MKGRQLRIKRWKRIAVAAAIAVGASAVNAAPASAADPEIDFVTPWYMGGAFTKAGSSNEYGCGSGLWMKDRNTFGSYYLAMPASCFYESSAALSPLSAYSKYYKTENSDGLGNQIWDLTEGDTILRGANSYESWNLVLIKAGLPEEQLGPTKFVTEYCSHAGPPCPGIVDWTGGSSGIGFEDTGTIDTVSKIDWLYGGDTIVAGSTACKSTAYDGTSCGTVNSGSTNFVQDTGHFSLPDWETPAKTITYTPTNVYCGTAGGLRDGAGGVLYVTGGGADGGGDFEPGGITGGDDKVALAGIVLGPTSTSSANHAACFAASGQPRGQEAAFLTADSIHLWAATQYGLNLEVLDSEDDHGRDGENTTKVAADLWDDTGTYTIGNKAIPGTNYNVSCWQTFNQASYGDGVSILGCYRYYNPTGALVTVDTYTLPSFCNSVSWDGTAGTARLFISNGDFNADYDYPYVGWNGGTTGCYKGTDQSGSAAWYSAATKTTSTCDTSGPTTSGCSIINNGNAGGSSWNSPGVSRDTWARGVAGNPTEPPSSSECTTYPVGCSIFSRIIYTQ